MHIHFVLDNKIVLHKALHLIQTQHTVMMTMMPIFQVVSYCSFKCSMQVYQLPCVGDELEDEPDLPPPRRPQQRTVPTRPQAKRPGNHDDSLIEELKTLSPEMQRYIKSMQQRNRGPIPPVRPESELQDRMSDMQLDDAGPSRPPAGRGSPRVPGGPQNPKSSARTRGPRVAEPYRDNSPEDDSDSDEDGDPAPLHGRAIITSTDSNNVNSTTVVDSHNDNSTRTEITKAYGGRDPCFYLLVVRSSASSLDR